ncbi:MAG: O-antigen ligase family protein [Bacteroidales bacterium]|nr:O-antigen ligase family protein [Bacteroidales bacterium]
MTKQLAKVKKILHDRPVVIIFLLLSIAGLPFVYVTRALDPVLAPGTLLISIILFLFLTVLMFKSWKRPFQFDFAIHPFFLIYLGYVAFSGVSLLVSVNLGEGLWDWLRTAQYFIFFIIAVLIFKESSIIHLTIPKMVLIYSTTILITGIYQLVVLLQNSPLDHQSSYLITSVLAHRNLFAEMLFLTIPFLLMGVYFHRTWWRYGFLALTFLSLLMITLLLVRSVWLATVAATVVSGLMLIFFRKSLEITFSKITSLIIYLAVALMIVVAATGLYSRLSTFETFRKQADVIGSYKFGSALERVVLWEKSLEMFSERPLTGVGAGSWKILLPKYGTEGLRSAEGVIIFQRPHNDFVWVLAENGIFAFLFYFALLVLAFMFSIRIIRKSTQLNEKYVGLFLLFFVTGYVIIASLSFPKERPDQSVFLHLTFAFLFVKNELILKTSKQFSKSIITFSFLIFIGLLLFTFYVGLIRLKSEIHTKKAFEHRANSNWQMMIDEIEVADTYFSKLDPTATPLRWYSGLGWYNLGEKDKALADFQDAYQSNPFHMHVLNNLATFYGIKNENELAIHFYKKAVQISPTFAEAAMNLAVIYLLTGQPDSAYLVLRVTENAQTHPNYRTLVTQITNQRIEALKETVDDRVMSLALTRIRNSDDWMVKVFEQAIHDHNELDRQLIIEVVYLLEKVDKSINQYEAELYRQKYL